MSDVDKFFEGDEEEYMELVRNSELSVGDKVRVTRSAREGEKGWQNAWTPSMDMAIGNTHTISSLEGPYGVRFHGEEFGYPIFVLEKV